MGEFDDGSATRMAEERIFMWETSDLLDKDLKKSFQEYLFSFKKADSFYEHAKKHAEAIGYNGDNREELVNFIHARCKKSEIYFSQPDEENKKQSGDGYVRVIFRGETRVVKMYISCALFCRWMRNQ